MLLAYLKTSYAYVIPPILGFFVLMGLFLVSLIRGKRKPVNLLFAAICLMGALINADVALVNIIPEKNLAIVIDRITYIVFVFSSPIYIQFVHSVLQITHRRWLEIAAYISSLFFLLLVPTDLFIKGFAHFSFGVIAQAGEAFHLFSAVSAFTVIYCLYTLLGGMRRAKNNQQKNRIKYILGGLGLSSFLLALNILPVSGIDVYPLGNFSFIPAIVLGVGVLKYDLLDIGAVVRRGTLYFLLTLTLTLVYILFIGALNWVFFDTAWNRTVLLPFLLAVSMVFLYHPVKNRLQTGIDKLFYRGKYDYQQVLKRVSSQLSLLLKTEEIKRLLTDSVASALQTDHVSLLLRDGRRDHYILDRVSVEGDSATLMMFPANHPLVSYLLGNPYPLSELNLDVLRFPKEDVGRISLFFREAEASLVIPMVIRESLLGAIVLGQKKSGELFFYEDLELLSTLANQSAVAFENARIYQELEQMNESLEKKVEERTADLRQAMAEKEKAQVQLIRSESLAAIGQLVAGTAHELNNPMASASSLIQTAIETMKENEPAGQDRDEILSDLEFSLSELKRAADIVKSLLGLSRQTQTYVESVNLNQVLDDALRVLHNQFKHTATRIIKQYDTDLPDIEGNFANLGQVFINIIKNAYQALPPEGGDIILTTAYRPESNTVIIECRDTGKGIPEGQIEHIFKPFFTTKAVGQGTGLGLYICHEIIRRHEGSITATSKPGEGTIVSIELPRRRRDL